MSHEFYITRCLQIAKNGLGSTKPNPMVGCVIVHDDIVIGEGFTSKYGGPHAEVNAINSVKSKSLLKNSTLYVTLEPCSHHGKTPPCSDLIIEHGIPFVVIGCVDDNPDVAGKGIDKLRKSGCQVTAGILESKCKEHHKRFFTFHNKKRPYIILKWAQTKDGFIAPESKPDQKPVWITGVLSRQLVHKWRSEEQAILVGANTVLEDNPSLTVRDWSGQNPTRVVIDRYSDLPKNAPLFNNESKNLIIPYKDVNKICHFLFKNNINSIIVEGGLKTLQSFIDANTWDEARVFIGNAKFENGVQAPKFSGKLISENRIETDTLNVYLND